MLDFQRTKWKVIKNAWRGKPKFYTAMKNQQRGMNRSKVIGLAPTRQAQKFWQFHILGSGMAIHAPWTIITQHFSWNRVDNGCFFFIGWDIFLSDNLNPDQFLLTQTFGCIAVISGWVTAWLPYLRVSSLSLRSQVRNKETERAKIVSFLRSSAALCYCLGWVT